MHANCSNNIDSMTIAMKSWWAAKELLTSPFTFVRSKIQEYCARLSHCLTVFLSHGTLKSFCSEIASLKTDFRALWAGTILLNPNPIWIYNIFCTIFDQYHQATATGMQEFVIKRRFREMSQLYTDICHCDSWIGPMKTCPPIHYNLPTYLEHHIQETGKADGRNLSARHNATDTSNRTGIWLGSLSSFGYMYDMQDMRHYKNVCYYFKSLW